MQKTLNGLQIDFRLQTFIFKLQILGVRLWTSVSDLDNWQTSDFGSRLGFWTLDILWIPGFEQTYVVCLLQTLDIIQTVFGQTSDIKLRFRQTSYIRLPIVDFRHQFSDFGLWTSDIGLLQTSDCSLHCQTSYRHQTSDSKTRTIYLSHNKNKHTYVTK